MIVLRADIGHVAALRGPTEPPLRQPEYQRLAALVANGAYAAVVDGRPVALGGLYGYPDGSAREAWIRVSPGSRSSLRLLLRCVSRILDVERRDGPPIVARTAKGNEAGRRLVQMLGFERTGRVVERADQWMLT